MLGPRPAVRDPLESASLAALRGRGRRDLGPSSARSRRPRPPNGCCPRSFGAAGPRLLCSQRTGGAARFGGKTPVERRSRASGTSVRNRARHAHPARDPREASVGRAIGHIPPPPRGALTSIRRMTRLLRVVMLIRCWKRRSRACRPSSWYRSVFFRSARQGRPQGAGRLSALPPLPPPPPPVPARGHSRAHFRPHRPRSLLAGIRHNPSFYFVGRYAIIPRSLSRAEISPILLARAQKENQSVPTRDSASLHESPQRPRPRERTRPPTASVRSVPAPNRACGAGRDSVFGRNEKPRAPREGLSGSRARARTELAAPPAPGASIWPAGGGGGSEAREQRETKEGRGPGSRPVRLTCGQGAGPRGRPWPDRGRARKKGPPLAHPPRKRRSARSAATSAFRSDSAFTDFQRGLEEAQRCSPKEVTFPSLSNFVWREKTKTKY